MPFFEGERSANPEATPKPTSTPESQNFETNEQLATQVEEARNHFLDITLTEGLSSEIAIEAVRAYHDALQALADTRGDDRDIWFNTEVLNAYIEAAEKNPEYQPMVESAQEDLEMLQ